MVQRLVPLALIAAALTVPAAAGASAVSTPRLCYLAGETIVLNGSGFTPNTPIRVDGDGTTPLAGAADDSGAFNAFVRTPAPSRLGLRSTTPADLVLTATDTESGDNASTVVSVALLTFRVHGGLKDATLPRTFDFSGWMRSRKPIYGHYRFRGRTLLTQRFGRPSGPCGTLTVRAAGMPRRVVHLGTWHVQFDQNPRYDAREKFAVRTPMRIVPLPRR